MTSLKTMKNKRMNTLYAVAGFVIVLLIWIVLSFILGETRLPSPLKVINKFVAHAYQSPEIALQGAGTKGFLPHVFTTLFRYLIGLSTGIALSIVLLIVISRFERLHSFIVPIVDIFRAIPPLALAPFMLLWFGTNAVGIVSIITFYSFTMVFIAGVEAINKLDPSHLNFGRTLGANKTTIATSIVLPSILPAMSGPIKVAASWSWGLVVVAELLGAKSGIGRVLNAFIPMLSTDLILVGILWILILAVGTERLINYVLERLLRWMPGVKE